MRHSALSILCCLLVACEPGEPRGNEDPGARPEIPPPAATERPDVGPVVVFLGTSLTAGLGLARAEETYVARIDAIADSVGRPIRTVNAGVSGDTSAGGLSRLDWILREPLDILVVELGANDGLRGQDPDALEANLVSVIEQTRERYPEARFVVAGMQAPPNLGPSYTSRFQDVFPEVAASTGAALVPFLLEGVAGVPELNQGDGIHPTPVGHDMMAHTVWTALAPLVQAWYGEHRAEGGAP